MDLGAPAKARYLSSTWTLWKLLLSRGLNASPITSHITNVHIYIYSYIHIGIHNIGNIPCFVHVYIYIYIQLCVNTYIYRERERDINLDSTNDICMYVNMYH